MKTEGPPAPLRQAPCADQDQGQEEHEDGGQPTLPRQEQTKHEDQHSQGWVSVNIENRAIKGTNQLCSGWVLAGPISKTVLMVKACLTISFHLIVSASLTCQDDPASPKWWARVSGQLCCPGAPRGAARHPRGEWQGPHLFNSRGELITGRGRGPTDVRPNKAISPSSDWLVLTHSKKENTLMKKPFTIIQGKKIREEEWQWDPGIG